MYTVFWSFWEYFWISGEFPATPKGFRSSVKPDWCSKTIPFPCLWALILVILAPILVMLFSKKWNVIRGGSLILKIMMIFILYEDWLQKIYTVWRLLPRDTTKPLQQLLQSRMSRHAYIYTVWRLPPRDPAKTAATAAVMPDKPPSLHLHFLKTASKKSNSCCNAV